jgi:hypothetical protein
MDIVAYVYNSLPHFSPEQTAAVALVWMGCCIFRMTSGLKGSKPVQIDRCLGVKVTSGFKGSAGYPFQK